MTVAGRVRAIVDLVATGRSRGLRWGIGLLMLAAACRGDAATDGSASYVLRVEARSAGSFEGRGQEAWAHDVVADGLTRARWFRAQGTGPELAARLAYEERTTPEGVPVLRVHLVVEPDAALAAELDAVGEALDAWVELERRDQTLELRRDLPVAVERALALLDAKLTIVRGDSAALDALLRDEDPEVVLLALDGVERRRVRTLGDAVVGLLEHADERVVLRAVECLGAVGGPEHAAGLLRVVPLADRAYANRLYDALAKLGGEQAHGFLAFAARNEDDPELAALAERALARLDAAEPMNATEGVARGHRQ